MSSLLVLQKDILTKLQIEILLPERITDYTWLDPQVILFEIGRIRRMLLLGLQMIN